jgi:ABC-type polysaccharide/polyol phosphate transport system ATPase subunit
MSVIRLDRVSKTYSRKASRQFLRSVLLNRRPPAQHEIFYALKNVDLELKEGDSLAVIGPNGAGKSTLLSLVAGLAWPDEGKVEVNGRVAALLELGSGFHPDLTGAENVLLNAALLGFSRRKARDNFDEIVAFSGIADFIDEPMRTYSAGMVMRLAFSVATNVDPEILLIDEVLAVGDESFSAKCIDKILELKRAGRVLICASHAMGTLRDLCNRAIWLDHGQVVRQGEAAELIQEYERSA